MVFIVGQTEQASEKTKLLQQLGQVFFLEEFRIDKISFVFFFSCSFLPNKNKILVVLNLMIMMIQVKQVMKLKQL